MLNDGKNHAEIGVRAPSLTDLIDFLSAKTSFTSTPAPDAIVSP